jgi:D-glycero-alpha-D-manno-heptose-7-phosphate kinase
LNIVHYIEMFNYPYASVSQQVPNATCWETERRLALIFLGKTHRSSDVHEMVIRGLEDAGPDCKQLADLRKTVPARVTTSLPATSSSWEQR